MMKTSPRTTISTLLQGHRSKVAMMSGASVLGGLAEAVFLVIITRAAFAVTDGRHTMGLLAGRTVSVATAMLLALSLVMMRIALAVAANAYSAATTAEVTAELRKKLAGAFLRSKWAAQEESQGGQLQELLTTYANAGLNLVSSFATGLTSGFSLVAMLLLAISVDPLGSIVAVLVVGVLGSTLRPLRARVRIQAQRAANDGMELATTTSEIADLGMVMHVFDVRDKIEDRVGNVLDRGMRSTRKLYLVRGLVPAIYTGLAYLVLVGAIASATSSSSTRLTSLGAVLLVMLRSLSYGQQLQIAVSGVHVGLPQVGDVLAEIERYQAQAFVDSSDPVEAVCPLVLEDVSFHYYEGQRVLSHVTAAILPNEMVGVVGPSGGGKSTLVQLLLGLREPVEGSVLANGKDIRTLRHSDWARKVTFVPQGPALISGTLADNIRFYRDGITEDAVTRAAKLAGLHDEILAFPQGYEHQIGDRGGNLSGGQQQRLCIARALAGHPELLILDEPTSALDARSEALIRDTLESLRGHMTIIVIAHRLSTIEQCDRIMVIQHGSIAAFDTPAALKREDNFYAEAVRLSGLS